MLCGVLQVSRSGYYRWRSVRAQEEAKQEADRQLLPRIRLIHAESRGSYGVRRITAALGREGIVVNYKRVFRLMPQAGLARISRRRRRPRTMLSSDRTPVATNLLAREFRADRPNQRWCGDITYIRLADGRFVYLAVVLDLYSRRVIGWSVQESLESNLVIEAQRRALWQPRAKKGEVLMHSDQGSQYQSREFRRLLAKWGVTQSLSRRGNCWDNAVSESFFASLEVELLARIMVHSVEKARSQLGYWIEHV